MTPCDRPIPTAIANRRTFLTGATAVAAGAALPLAARADQPRQGAQITRFAFITDVHINVGDPASSDLLQTTMAAIRADAPSLIIDGGDMTDFGAAAEYERFLQIVPESLRDRMCHVPGNHERKWDWSADETFVRYLGPTSSTRTIDGLRFISWDTSLHQQGGTAAPRSRLHWLAELLKAGPSDQPTIIVTHHPPMGEDFYFLPDEDELVEVIKPYRVRAILCGHIHRQFVRRCNGLTLLVGKDNKRHAGFYRLTRTRDAHTDRLAIDYVGLSDPAQPAVEPVTTIDLSGRYGPGEQLEPDQVEVRPEGDRLRVRVTRRDSHVEVAATLYSPALYNAKAKDTWTALVRDGREFSGSVPIDLAPGHYRAIVRTTRGDEQWRQIVPFRVLGQGLDEVWHWRLGDSLQGAAVRSGDLVVAAATSGEVAALRADRTGAHPVWRTRVAPSRHDPSVAAGLVYLASPDHHLYALDLATGRLRWAADLGTPVMADPLATTIGGEHRVLVGTGRSIVCLDTGGRTVWRKPLPQLVAGRPASDGQTVFFGCGDANAYAIDARTGALVWTYRFNDGPDDPKLIQNSPYIANALIASDRLVVIGNRRVTAGLDRGSGALVWSVEGNLMACPPAVVDDVVVVASKSDGLASGIAVADGSVRWQVPTAAMTDSAGVIVDGHAAYLTNDTGVITKVEVSSGVATRLGHPANTAVLGTPALLPDLGLLVVPGQDGVLRASLLPDTL